MPWLLSRWKPEAAKCDTQTPSLRQALPWGTTQALTEARHSKSDALFVQCSTNLTISTATKYTGSHGTTRSKSARGLWSVMIINELWKSSPYKTFGPNSADS